MPDSPPADAEFDQQEALAQLSVLLAMRTGLALMQTQWSDLRRAVTAAAGELGLADFRAGLDCLLTTTSTRPLQVLIDHLTIGETYFFRDHAVFSALRERLLPTLIDARREGVRHLRIWSAGCSSGEEAYSIAIELARALPDLAQWNATVLATDINQRFLRKAVRGIYDRWSFRNSAPEQCEPYIQRNADGHFAIAPAIRRLVHFSWLNLMETNYPSPLNATADIDIIFCRNVLMYLQPASASAVIQRLCNALTEGGWLIVSTVEAALVDLPELTSIRLPNLILFRKQDCSAQRVEVHSIQQARAPVFDAVDSIDLQPLSTASILPHATTSKKQFSEESFLRAQQLCAQGDYAQAELLLADHPDHPQKRLLLARIDANQGHFKAALEHCEQVLAIDKLNPVAHYLQATILLECNAESREGNSALSERDVATAAEAALKRTLYLDPDWVMAHIALGNLLAQQARHAEAKRHIENARTLLRNIPAQQPIAEADGLTAEQLLAMIKAMPVAEVLP